jgi:hypothetical protein
VKKLSVREAAKALLNDIEAMVEDKHASFVWFGPFGSFAPHGESLSVVIEWPNLVISAERLREALEEEEEA